MQQAENWALANDLPNRYVVTYDATDWIEKVTKNKGEHCNAISTHVDITFLCPCL